VLDHEIHISKDELQRAGLRALLEPPGASRGLLALPAPDDHDASGQTGGDEPMEEEAVEEEAMEEEAMEEEAPMEEE
jgi:hypothetical protein